MNNWMDEYDIPSLDSQLGSWNRTFYGEEVVFPAYREE